MAETSQHKTFSEAYMLLIQDEQFLLAQNHILSIFDNLAPAQIERSKAFLYGVLHGLNVEHIYVTETGGLKCFLIKYANRVIDLLELEYPKFNT